MVGPSSSDRSAGEKEERVRVRGGVGEGEEGDADG